VEKKTETDAPSDDAQPVANNFGQTPVSEAPKPVAAVAESATVPKLQALKTSAFHTSSTVSEVNATSPFSRDNIVRNLQEMVQPVAAAAAPVPDAPRTSEEAELNEKEKSALEFAISMYMAANEFYDGGSLWCRQCDDIFTDISALFRHIHSDKHQLVSSVLLLNICIYLHRVIIVYFVCSYAVWCSRNGFCENRCFVWLC